MAKLGKDRNPYRAAFLQFVGVAETRAEAMRIYKEPAEYFYQRCLHIDQRYAAPPGYVTEATVRAKVQSQVAAAAAPATNDERAVLTAKDMEGIVKNGYVIVGSPDEVAEQLKNVAHEMNVGHLMLLLQYGNMGKQLANYNTKLFAEKVMPQLKDVFSDWEDRWWPQGLSREERAEPAPVAALA
jgi:alkanesulfonate monooxygenase SsuD/methylene tetrahydromethanopterin reductase-like flavin-dependent oxidoreductase (luciferase family)